MSFLTEFYNIIDIGLFDLASLVLIVGYLIYEIPRSIKVMDEEYTKGFYPETGRVLDIALFIVGILTILFYKMNAIKIIAFVKNSGLIAFFLILLVVIPLLIMVGYLKRFFARFDSNKSVTLFLTHSFLDLMHTLFYLGFAVLLIPEIGFVIFGNP